MPTQVEGMKLAQLGWTQHFAELFAPWEKMHCIPGRIVGMQRDMYSVVTERGQWSARITGKFIHTAQCKGDYPAVGDWVALDISREHLLIKAVLPRKSKFGRKAPIRGGRKLKGGIIVGGTTEEQVIAANIDTVFVVIGLDQNFEPRRIERYLSLIVNSGATPVLLLNKADLHDNLDAYTAQLAAITEGISLHTVSAETGHNLDCLNEYLLPGCTVVFVGSSGAGKSTLTNRLLGEQRQKTCEISCATGKGRHTTTSSKVVFHCSGCMIIDTPGLRELQLWCDEEAVASTFEDIVELESRCKFRDCRHTNEPGCAILAALETGELTPDRFNSYQKQLLELHRLEARKKQLNAKIARRK